MKLRNPIQLTDADKARINKLTRWLPRVHVTLPARTAKQEEQAPKQYPY